MKIQVYNRQKDLKITSQSVKKTTQLILDFHKIDCDEIAVHFVSCKALCLLHQDFFQDPSPTDCITFPYDKDRSSGWFFLGEIFICPKTALRYIEVNEGDVYKEVTLYLVHGVLHLLGFNDLIPKEKRKMRAKEKQLMNYLAMQDQILTG